MPKRQLKALDSLQAEQLVDRGRVREIVSKISLVCLLFDAHKLHQGGACLRFCLRDNAHLSLKLSGLSQFVCFLFLRLITRDLVED